MISIGAALSPARGVYGIMKHYGFTRDGLIKKLTTKDTLVYTPSKYTSFTEAQALTGIKDGSTTSGLRAESAGTWCGIRLSFAAATVLNELTLYITQFNGNYNGFTGAEVWNSGYTVKHYDTTALGYGTRVLDLSATCPDADTSFILVCKNPYSTGNFSLAEVIMKGYVA